MKPLFTTIILTLSILLLSLSAWSGPGRTTYQAKIIKPDGLPLEASNVNFKFTILDPAGTCILYSETYSSVNMSSTSGLISFALGSGVKTYPASATTFEEVFSNITPSLSCDTGGPANYTPAASDIRKIVMQFHDGAGWQTLPAMSINAVPYAMYANEATKLNGLTSNDFVQLSTVPTCAASEALRYTGASFNCIAVGGGGSVTSSTVVTALGYTPADGASVTTLTSDLSAVSSTVAGVSTYASSVSSTVSSLASTVSSLQSSVAASFVAITSSQWTTSGTTINYMAGKVGIGTSNPISRLHVKGSVINDTFVTVTNSAEDYYAYMGVQDAVGGGNRAAAFVGSYSNHSLALRTGGADQILIDTAGNMSLNQNKKISAQSGLGPEGSEIELYNSGNHNMTFKKFSAGNFIFSDGYVGIGKSTPVTSLDVSGGVRISMESATCAASYAGTLRYNASNVEYCNGTSWQAFGVSGAGITNLNGSTSGTQSFAVGSGGIAPNFATANGVHTLNLPLASTGSVTAGLLSNADYTTFSNKITSSAASIAQVLGYVPADNSVSGTYAQKANNLSDLTNIVTARTNLGLGTFATASTIDLGGASSTGTLAIARLPSFTGDATITAASNTIILSNSGVSAGTYIKVTVDSKGRVTSGAQIVSSDVTTALGYTPASATAASQWTTSGTGIFYNTGNVGIGTTNFTHSVGLGGETARSIGVSRRTSANSNGNNLLIEAGGATSGATDKSGGNLVLSSGYSTGQGSSIIQFQTAAVSGTGTFDNTPTTRMQIDGYGNTTIMSADPNTSGNDSPNLIVTNPQSKFTFGRYGGINRFASGHSDGVTQKTLYMTGIGGVAADMAGLNIQTSNMNITTGGTSRFYMSSAGNVGIGATSPDSKLRVVAASGEAFKVDDGGTAIIRANSNGTVSFEKGNVGIGTTSPGAPLAFADSLSDKIQINGNAANSYKIAKAAPVNSGDSMFKFVAGATAAGEFGFYNGTNLSMLINSSGNVGIGITTPQSPLHIQTSSRPFIDIANSTANLTQNTIAGGIFFGTSATDWSNAMHDAGIQANAEENQTGTNHATYLALLTKPNTLGPGSASLERMRITGSGNVGVGTTSPGNRLTVVGGSDAFSTDIYGQSTGSFLRLGTQSGGVPSIDARNNANSANVNMALQVNGGNVGIGTTNPTALLNVSGGSNSGVAVDASGGNTYLDFRAAGTKKSNVYWDSVNNRFSINDVGAGPTVMNTNGGYVGIGITTPGSKLDVKGDNVNNTFRTTDASGQYRARIDQFYDFYMTSASGTDTMVIKNSGNVGIGTTSPTAALDVSGDIKLTGTISNGNIWQNATLINSWVSYGSGYSTPGYKKFSDNIVRLRGLVMSGTPPSVIFVLPVGMRPGYAHEFSVACSGAVPCEVIVSPNGNVYAETGASSWMSLDGIWFEIGE